jgi:hypothetical protein
MWYNNEIRLGSDLLACLLQLFDVLMNVDEKNVGDIGTACCV